MAHPAAFLSIHGTKHLVTAVGERGKILMFRGPDYQPLEVPLVTTDTLRAVFVESEYSAWAVGDGGTILHWNGEKWWPVATATQLPGPLNAIWAHADDGVWIGGARVLINRHPKAGSSTYASDASIRCIWGRGEDDLWVVSDGRLLLHWQGERCARIPLPGDDDEEWNAVAGTPDGDTFLCGPSGFFLHHADGRWMELPTDTTDLITGAVCTGPALYVCTDAGQVRRWDGRRWTTEAFSAFGALRSIAYIDGVIWVAGDHAVVIQHRPDDHDGG